MGEQVVSGRTRGEHGRGLDLEKITAIQGHTFVCPKTEHFIVLLKNGRKYAINGEVITEQPVSAEFRMHRFATKDDEIAALLRKSAPFARGEVKELQQAKDESAAAKARRVKEMLDADPDLAEAVAALSKGKDAGDEPEIAPKKTAPRKTSTAKKS
jgi:hypothetical protein